MILPPTIRRLACGVCLVVGGWTTARAETRPLPRAEGAPGAPRAGIEQVAPPPAASAVAPGTNPPAARQPVVQAAPHPDRVPQGMYRLPELPRPETLPYTDPNAIVAPRATQGPPGPVLRAPAPAAPPGSREMELPSPQIDVPAEPLAGEPALGLAELLASVDRDYPLLAAILQERGITAGDLLAADGPFNLMAKGQATTDPQGFYQLTRSNFYLDQPTWRGGNVYLGYRLGRGDYPTWYDDETNNGGEFRAGFLTPLLRDLAIDKRRADLFKARVGRQLAEPVIAKQRIEFFRAASVTYWNWVAAGRRYAIAEELLRIARLRDDILAKRVELGDVAPIQRTDNQRVIVDRQAKLISAGRKFQAEAIKLSLFYRDRQGNAAIPPAHRLPRLFPEPTPPTPSRLNQDVATALALRPELRQIRLQRDRARVDLAYARNQLMPSFDWGVKAAQDVGAPTPKRDKSPFQLETGVYMDVPVQRSAARGQMQAAQSKIAQLTAQERFAGDKIVAEVQDALSDLIAAHQKLAPARESVQLTHQMEVAERKRFELGDSSLFVVNLRELETADSAGFEVDAVALYFASLADFRAALGLDAQPTAVPAGP